METWKRRAERSSRLRWEIIGPILLGVFLIGVLFGALVW